MIEHGAVAFPPGTHYAVTWSLEVIHGGMTSALLHRSRAFVRNAAKPVTIITFKYQEDLDDVVEDLRSRGLVIDGMNVINLWKDLRSWEDDLLRSRLAESEARRPEHFEPIDGGGIERKALCERLVREDGEIERVDYFRPDGSLMVSYRKFVHGDKGVAVTFCDRMSEPIATFHGIRMVYRFWLDSLPRDPVAFMVIDSKTTANLFPDYRRADVITIYMVHGSHLVENKKTMDRELSPSRAYAFGHLRDFDSVIFLTERQRLDVQMSFGPLDNLHVCPNSRAVVRSPGKLPARDRKQGIAVGALRKGKRFGDAAKAISFARRHGVFVRLTIFGRGSQELPLRRSIRRHLLCRTVKLGGHTRHPEAEMARSSFILMTSHHEGFGLVLIEAMAQGCVPIVYDIDYGPSEIITDGVDGYLVEPGNFAALGRAIHRFVRMPSAERARMREATVRRSLDFNDNAIVRRWQTIFEDAKKRKSQR